MLTLPVSEISRRGILDLRKMRKLLKVEGVSSLVFRPGTLCPCVTERKAQKAGPEEGLHCFCRTALSSSAETQTGRGFPAEVKGRHL